MGKRTTDSIYAMTKSLGQLPRNTEGATAWRGLTGTRDLVRIKVSSDGYTQLETSKGLFMPLGTHSELTEEGGREIIRTTLDVAKVLGTKNRWGAGPNLEKLDPNSPKARATKAEADRKLLEELANEPTTFTTKTGVAAQAAADALRKHALTELGVGG